jgi:hypothetical protein
MSGLLGLSEAARRAVVKILAPAEPVVFVTAPEPSEAARAAWPTAAAGGLLFLLGAPIAWLSIVAAWAALRWGEAAILPIVLAILAVPACLMGTYLMLAPHAAWRRARDTVILVTDRRLVALSVSGRPGIALPAGAILGVERKKVERGYGTLEVRHEAQGDTAETILAGIDNVLEAESAIRKLSLDRSVTLIAPVN